MSFRAVFYLVMALVGLIVPWFFNIRFMQQGTLIDFIVATWVNDATRSIGVDLLAAAAAGCVWMGSESKRLGMRRGWVWTVLTFTVAFGFAFPLFLFVRQRHLERAA